MPELNENVPIFACLIRKEYLYDLQKHHGEYETALVFGLASVYGRALGFHLLTETGAQVARVPLSALVFKEHEPHLPLHYLQLWDCFAYECSVIDFDLLHEMRVQVILRDKQVIDGSYMFTVDWYGNSSSEQPGEDGHKNAHVIQLDCGCIAAQPNNRILWHEPSVITAPANLRAGERPDYLINTHKWKCEIDTKWTAEDSYRMFYDDNDLDVSTLTPEDKALLAAKRAKLDVNWPEENDRD
jgi:hypothetical protein